MGKIFSDYKNVVYFHYNELSDAIIKFEKYNIDFLVDKKECAIYFNEDDVYDEYKFRNEVVDNWHENFDYKNSEETKISKLTLNIPEEYSGWISSLLERGLMEHQTSYGDMIPVPNEVVVFIKEFYEYEQNKDE